MCLLLSGIPNLRCVVRAINLWRTVRYNGGMQYTASSLRQNIYKILDKSIKTGEVLQIVPPQKVDRFANLVEHNTMVGDPEEFVHLDWSSEWKI